MKILAKCYAGFEALLAQEIEELGGTEIQQVKRGVTFQGDTTTLYKCNYCSRLGLRFLVKLKASRLRDEEELYDFIGKIPWEDYFGLKQSFTVDAVVSSQTFTHSQYVALKTKDAIVDRFRKKFHKRPNARRIDPDIRINIHIYQQNCTVSLDSSGESLHKRNYKIHQVSAPLSEVLAAGLLKLAGYDGSQDLLDPMCGSGTLGMEAFMMQYNIPAGYFRENFSMMNWSHFKPEMWKTVIEEAQSQIDTSSKKAKLINRDKQLSNTRKVQENFSKFEAFDQTHVTIERQNFLKSKANNNLLMIINPPYDDKLEVDDILGFYQQIGNVLKQHYTDCQIWILSGHFDAMKFIGLKTTKRHELLNGAIPVKYFCYDIYEGSKKHS